jgi:O-antigen/teichoic acid export membrane protein
MTGMVAFPFFAGLAVLSEPLVALVFGPDWLGAAPVLSVMALMGLYISINRVQMSFCLAAGQAGAITLLAWAVVTLGAVLTWAASPFGLVAMAAALVAAHYLLWPVYFATVSRIAGLPAADFVTCHGLPALGAGLMAAAVVPVARVLDAPLGVVAAAVPVGAVVFAAFAGLTMRDRLAMLLSYARGRAADA